MVNQDEYVIVAEDSKPNRAVIVLLFKRLGFKVLECEDGDVAWEIITENNAAPEPKKIVAVFSDIMMPKMDGLELLRRVRNDALTAKLPFVLVTAVSDKDYLFEAKNLQVDGYILKPVTLQRIASKIKDLFPERVLPEIAS